MSRRMPWSMRCAGAASRSSRRNSRLAEECNAEQLQAVSTALLAQIAESSAHKGKKGLSALDLAEAHFLVDHARGRALKSLQQRLSAQEQVQQTLMLGQSQHQCWLHLLLHRLHAGSNAYVAFFFRHPL